MRIFSFLGAALCLLASTPPILAQTPNGQTIRGQVIDRDDVLFDEAVDPPPVTAAGNEPPRTAEERLAGRSGYDGIDLSQRFEIDAFVHRVSLSGHPGECKIGNGGDQVPG